LSGVPVTHCLPAADADSGSSGVGRSPAGRPAHAPGHGCPGSGMLQAAYRAVAVAGRLRRWSAPALAGMQHPVGRPDGQPCMVQVSVVPSARPNRARPARRCGQRRWMIQSPNWMSSPLITFPVPVPARLDSPRRSRGRSRRTAGRCPRRLQSGRPREARHETVKPGRGVRRPARPGAGRHAISPAPSSLFVASSAWLGSCTGGGTARPGDRDHSPIRADSDP
jgi:hypothetical protein